jgi:hypothetical protein
MPDMPRDPERTRGRYVVTLDGRPAGSDERFVLGDIAPGVWRIRTTRVSAHPTSRLESDVRIDASGTSVAVRWVGSAVDVVREASADLLEQAGVVSGTRSVEGHAYDEVAAGGRLHTPAHVVSGPLLLDAVDGIDVVEPYLLDASDERVFLEPVVLRWTTTRTGEDSVLVAGEERAGTAYDWVASSTGREAAVLIDAGGLLLRTRVTTPEGELEVRLVEVDGPWPTPLSWGAGSQP